MVDQPHKKLALPTKERTEKGTTAEKDRIADYKVLNAKEKGNELQYWNNPT
jgi:hypothetical protein